MKLATVLDRQSSQRVVIIDAARSKAFDVKQAAQRDKLGHGEFDTMLTLVNQGERGLDLARRLLQRRELESDLWSPLDDVRLLAPLPCPPQMRDGMNFALHIQQAGRGVQRISAQGDPEKLAALDKQPLPDLPEIYKLQPFYYITNRFTVAGPDDVINWPRYSKLIDYELEFGIVTCNTAANIPLARAKDHIFGFTIFNDFSARDAQAPEMQSLLGPSKGKSFDGSNVLGPWIVTYDEIGDPYDLATQVRVNGEVRSNGRTKGMLFSFEEILAHASKDETIHAGEFFGSGTVGNGCGLEIGRFLEDGDTVELDVEKIGVLRNKVVTQK